MAENTFPPPPRTASTPGTPSTPDTSCPPDAAPLPGDLRPVGANHRPHPLDAQLFGKAVLVSLCVGAVPTAAIVDGLLDGPASGGAPSEGDEFGIIAFAFAYALVAATAAATALRAAQRSESISAEGAVA
jgi:hypothetical protein